MIGNIIIVKQTDIIQPLCSRVTYDIDDVSMTPKQFKGLILSLFNNLLHLGLFYVCCRLLRTFRIFTQAILNYSVKFIIAFY